MERVLCLSNQIFYHFTRDDQSRDRRDKRGGRGYRASDIALLSQSGNKRRVGLDRFFTGIDYFQLFDAALAALGAHHARKRTKGRFADIADLKGGRVELVARPHRADDRHACFLRVQREGKLARNRVDRVDDVVIL